MLIIHLKIDIPEVLEVDDIDDELDEQQHNEIVVEVYDMVMTDDEVLVQEVLVEVDDDELDEFDEQEQQP